ncbi:MAG: hypothetical protein M3Y45_10515, partial [Actinomycetota bacterium]|nr:hypothetical protein [Actinomycetota bacterium]
IEADAALATELDRDGNEIPPPPGSAAEVDPDPVLAARVSSLEAELAAEKAAKTEALVKAEARLKEIESAASAAEERVAAAEAAAGAAAAAKEPEPLSSAADRTEAEAREAAVAWLRGQIGALRKELASPPAPGGPKTGDS